MIQRDPGKISGPLPDRIDLHTEVPTAPYKELRSRVGRARARTIQYAPKTATVAVTATLPHHFNSAANLALNVEFIAPGKSSLV